MFRSIVAAIVTFGMALLAQQPASAEILAMMNYESKTPETLKALKIGGANEREASERLPFVSTALARNN